MPRMGSRYSFQRMMEKMPAIEEQVGPSAQMSTANPVIEAYFLKDEDLETQEIEQAIVNKN